MPRKPSDLIEIAYQYEGYLVTTNWLCSVIRRMRNQDLFSAEEERLCSNEIYDSLKGAVTLRAYLISTGKIDRKVAYGSAKYKRESTKFWIRLIADLRKAGK